MVTPLGCGVETTRKRLINGECGFRVVNPEDLKMNGFENDTIFKRVLRLSPFFIPRILINMAAGHVSMNYGFQGIAPLTLNLTKPDPVFHGDFIPLIASKEMQIKAALSKSFGFGGTNASLLFTSTS